MLRAPRQIAPCASSRSTSVASRGAGGLSRLIFDPARVVTPSRSNRFLTAKGTPASGPEGTPGFAAPRRCARALARARSAGHGREGPDAPRPARRSGRERASTTASADQDPSAMPRGDSDAVLVRTAAHGRNTGAGSASSSSGKSSTRAANRAVASRFETMPGRYSGSISSRSSGAIASMTAPASNWLVAHRTPPPICRSGVAQPTIAPWADDHLDRRRLELGKVALRRILDQQALVAAVIGLAHRGLDADFRRDAGEHQMA